MLTSFKRGAIYVLKSSHKFGNHYFVIFWEALQFEIAVPQLHTFHMDLQPPTHVQLITPMMDIMNMLCLSVMQISKSLGNHLHIGINQRTCLGYVVHKPQS
jgi:hypothetical protein